MQTVWPCLWCNNNAAEMVEFYKSIFGEELKILSESPVVVTFELRGQKVMLLNGGDSYKLSPAISLYVDCKDQAEVDRLWAALLRGGKASQCGWLDDKFGLSWQIIPNALPRLMGDADRVKADRVMQAMLKMVKIDVAELEKAYNEG